MSGDVMLDATRNLLSAQPLSAIEHRAGLTPDAPGIGGYYLATVHRAENTDDPVRLSAIFDTFGQLDPR